jgi:5-formyltetrahydrofolate cyclo-ligase
MRCDSNGFVAVPHLPASPTKSELRLNALSRRSAIAPEDHLRWSRRISERLHEAIAALPAPAVTVAGYCSIRAEVNVLHGLTLLAEAGHITALPRVESAFHQLTFHHWQAGDALIKSAYAIDEPDAQTEIIVPDIIIVPLLAFDRSLHRLGYGRGYYDATLAHLRKTNPALLAIGAAFSLQELPLLPPDDHDQRLDMVVTEKEVIQD